MELSGAREAAFRQHVTACKEIAANGAGDAISRGKSEEGGKMDGDKIDGGKVNGGKSDWQQEYIIKKLDSDIVAVKTDLNIFRVEVKEEFKNFRAEVKAEINSVRTELKADINDVKKEVKAFSRWAISAMITMVVGFVTVLAAVLRH